VRVKRLKGIAAASASAAIITAVAIVGIRGNEPDHRQLAGGSGDSATGTSYVQPTLPTMSLASTTVDAATTVLPTAASTLVTALASPTYKASPAPECVNNGQCP
jgi:hypothetical protein